MTNPELLIRLSEKAMAENATADDWVTLIRAAYSPTPTIVPFAVEVFFVALQQWQNFQAIF